MRRPLCEAAKRGHLCIDDLCHTGGETLCGFCPYDYDDMVDDENNWQQEDEDLPTYNQLRWEI